MSEKRGRPKKAEARRQEKNIGFYVTHAQYAVIQRKAEQADVNISDYMRQVAVRAEVRAKWTAEEREMVKVLIGMAVELHRLSGADRPDGAGVDRFDGADRPGGAQGAAFFLLLRDKMDMIIKKLCHDK